jgi:hypothetical protein
MKLKAICLGAVLVLLVSACGSAPDANSAPTLSGEAVQNTAIAAAFTLVAQTQAAIPTNTLPPPSETPTLAPTFTNTPEPSPTLDLLSLSPTLVPTFTAQPTTAASGNDPCNKPLTKWQGPSASFNVVNETKPKGEIILLMSVSTPFGECGYLNIYSDSFSGPAGNYSAAAFVSGPKNFKVFGSFAIQEAGWKIVVRNETIVALGACYPKC